MNAELLVMFVKAIAGTIARIVTITDVKIPKKWGLLNVTKMTDKSVKVGCSYSSCVNRHRAAEGKETDFVAEKLPLGEWLVINRVITHKDARYFRMYDFPNNIHKVTYYVNGHVATDIELAIIKEWQKSQKHSSRQGVENEIRPTNVNEENIIYFANGGQVFDRKLVEHSIMAEC